MASYDGFSRWWNEVWDFQCDLQSCDFSTADHNAALNLGIRARNAEMIDHDHDRMLLRKKQRRYLPQSLIHLSPPCSFISKAYWWFTWLMVPSSLTWTFNLFSLKSLVTIWPGLMIRCCSGRSVFANVVSSWLSPIFLPTSLLLQSSVFDAESVMIPGTIRGILKYEMSLVELFGELFLFVWCKGKIWSLNVVVECGRWMWSRAKATIIWLPCLEKYLSYVIAVTKRGFEGSLVIGHASYQGYLCFE